MFGVKPVSLWQEPLIRLRMNPGGRQVHVAAGGMAAHGNPAEICLGLMESGAGCWF